MDSIEENRNEATFYFDTKIPSVRFVDGKAQIFLYTSHENCSTVDEFEDYQGKASAMYHQIFGDEDGEANIAATCFIDDVIDNFIDDYRYRGDFGDFKSIEMHVDEAPFVDAIKLSLMQALEKINAITFAGESEQ